MSNKHLALFLFSLMAIVCSNHTDDEKMLLIKNCSDDSLDDIGNSSLSVHETNCQKSEKEGNELYETRYSDNVSFEHSADNELQEVLLFMLKKKPFEISFNEQFRRKYASNQEGTQEFVPFTGVFPLCPSTENNGDINSVIQFLLASQHFMSLDVPDDHINFNFFSDMRCIKGLSTDIRSNGTQIMNDPVSLKKFIFKNRNLKHSIFSFLRRNGIESDHEILPNNLLYEVLSIISYYFKYDLRIGCDFYGSYEFTGVLCSKCRVFYRQSSTCKNALAFRISYLDDISISKKLEKLFLNPNGDGEKNKRPLYCRVLHLFNKKEVNRFEKLPLMLFLFMNEDIVKENKKSTNKMLHICQKIYIHGIQYHLKAAILQHARDNGGFFQSVLLIRESQWYHQLNHYGKIVTDINAVLNEHPHVRWLLYEQ